MCSTSSPPLFVCVCVFMRHKFSLSASLRINLLTQPRVIHLYYLYSIKSQYWRKFVLATGKYSFHFVYGAQYINLLKWLKSTWNSSKCNCFTLNCFSVIRRQQAFYGIGLVSFPGILQFIAHHPQTHTYAHACVCTWTHTCMCMHTPIAASSHSDM